MQHISDILPEQVPTRGSAPWQRAAEAAYAIARAQADHPASLHQLRRVCQLLTSHTVQERERRRAFVILTQGCTKDQASAMLEYFIPVIRARKAAEARLLLGPLAA
jgi:hypothetical protein